MIARPTGPLAPELERRLSDLYDVAFLAPGPAPAGGGSAGARVVGLPPGELGRLVNAGDAGVSDLLDCIAQGVAWIDGSGRVLWANSAFAALEPAVLVAVLDRCAAEVGLVPPSPAPGPSFAGVRRFDVALDSDNRAVETTITPMPAAAPATGDVDQRTGRQAGGQTFAVVVRDVSADRRLQRKLDAIDRVGAELVRLDADTIRRMDGQQRLDLLESKIVKACRDLLQFDHFVIRLIDDRSGRLELVIASGLPEEAKELELYPLPEGNGISGHVAATGRSYICYDTEKDPRFLLGITGARSSLTVPLLLNDKVIGTFDIESRQVGRFSEDDRQFAEIFGRYIAIALHTLQVLVVERTNTNQTVSLRVEGEVNEPLADILREMETLKRQFAGDPETVRHLDRIGEDVGAVRRRLRNVASGPQTLLGIEDEMAQRREDPALKGRRVLVADDDSTMRRLIHDILANRGCVVETHVSGVGAITAMEEVAAGRSPPFSVVLSDIKMPDRNGYDVFAAVRRLQPGVPVILMTGFGYDPSHSIVRASQAGLQSVLFKPFQVARLLEEVRKAVLISGAPQAGGGAEVPGLPR